VHLNEIKFIFFIIHAEINLTMSGCTCYCCTSIHPGTAAAVGVGAGAFGALGAVVMGFTGPVAIASLTAAAVGTAIAGKLRLASDLPPFHMLLFQPYISAAAVRFSPKFLNTHALISRSFELFCRKQNCK